ncbi:MAG TPA: group 1 truncated hemoglobin [Polyangia bacterium]|jgi:hemoglobin
MKRLIILLAIVTACGCAQSAASQRDDGSLDLTTLYDRLGGRPAIAAVVDGFVAKVAGDKRVNRYFWNTNVPELKELLVEMICQATGGPCQYTGRDMKTAHAGMNIQPSEFTAVVEDLVSVLDRLHVAAHEQHQLLALLAPTKKDIVGQ